MTPAGVDPSRTRPESAKRVQPLTARVASALRGDPHQLRTDPLTLRPGRRERVEDERGRHRPTPLHEADEVTAGIASGDPAQTVAFDLAEPVVVTDRCPSPRRGAR